MFCALGISYAGDFHILLHLCQNFPPSLCMTCFIIEIFFQACFFMLHSGSWLLQSNHLVGEVSNRFGQNKHNRAYLYSEAYLLQEINISDLTWIQKMVLIMQIIDNQIHVDFWFFVITSLAICEILSCIKSSDQTISWL